MKKKKIILYFIIIILVITMIVCLLTSNLFGVAIQGMVYMIDNDDYDCSAQVLTESIEFTLNLSDPSSNIGKIIYQNEKCYIEISEIDTDNEYYRLFLRAHGDYSVKAAKLITGTDRSDDSVDLCAKLQIKELNIFYNCGGAGTSAMYRDGDEFGFYILSEEYMNSPNFTDVDDIREMTFCLSELVINEWSLGQ